MRCLDPVLAFNSYDRFRREGNSAAAAPAAPAITAAAAVVAAATQQMRKVINDDGDNGGLKIRPTDDRGNTPRTTTVKRKQRQLS